MEQEHQLLKGLRSKSCCPPSVLHRGSLHWCPYDANEIGGHRTDIIVFDTEAESFRWMCSPTAHERDTCFMGQLDSQLDRYGCLGDAGLRLEFQVPDRRVNAGGITTTLFNLLQKEKENTT